MNKAVLAYIVSAATLIVAVWLGVSIGTVKIPISTFWDSSDTTASNILWKIRMPRVHPCRACRCVARHFRSRFPRIAEKPARGSIHTRSVIRRLGGCCHDTLFRFIDSNPRHIHITRLQYDRGCNNDVPRHRLR